MEWKVFCDNDVTHFLGLQLYLPNLNGIIIKKLNRIRSSNFAESKQKKKVTWFGKELIIQSLDHTLGARDFTKAY